MINKTFSFFFLYYSLFVMGTEYYIDSSFQSISEVNGSKTEPFNLFDDAIGIFNNKSSLGNIYFSNETKIQIKEETHVFFQK